MRKLNIPRIGLDLKYFKKLGKLNKPSRVLVFESTGFDLHGAVASSTAASSLTLGPSALSSQVDLAAAVGEVLAQLKDQGKKTLPKTAVLITPCAAGALHTLPVNPKKPRPDSQMAELVRWELEELLVQQSELWTLGALLMGRGTISAEQRRQIETKAAAEGGRTGAAAYASLVDSAQIDECLALQELWAGGDDTEMATGWVCLPGGDEEDGFLWSVAGTGAGICESWARAFAKHGIHLDWLYPRLGACLPLINGNKEGWLLVDVLQEQMALFRGMDRQPDYLNLRPCVTGRVDVADLVEAVRDLVRPETRTIYCSALPDQEEALFQALGEAFSRTSIKIERPETTGSEADGFCFLSMAGTARHALGLAKGVPLVRIRAQKPPPPLWRRKELWPWAAIALVATGIVSYESYARVQIAKNNAELTRLDIEYEKQLQLKAQAEALAREARQLEEELTVKRRELNEKKRMAEILDKVIRYRQDLVPGTLEAIREAMSDGVIIDIFEENATRTGFRLEGWAVTDTEGQTFASELNEKLEPWGYRIRESKITRGTNWLKMDGYQLKIWAVMASDSTKPAEGASATPPPATQKSAAGKKKKK